MKRRQGSQPLGRLAGTIPLALLLLGLPAAVALAQPAAAPAPAADAADARFEITEFRVLGNTVLPVRVVEAAVYAPLGPERSFQDIEAARAALESAYHDAGFGTVFVDIPEQRVDDGIVRLRATEGRLHSVRVEGLKYFSGRQIRAQIPAATEDAVPSVPALQAQLATVNAETPDRTVVPVLKAGPEPGTVDLDLNVEDHLPLHLSAEVNNQYSDDTKPLRAIVSADYSNLFGHLDDLSAQYQTSPQNTKNVGVLALSFAHRFDTGQHLTLSYIDSSSNVATVGALDVLGAGHMFGLHYDDPLVARPGLLETFNIGFDYKRFDQTVNAGLGATVPSPVSYGLLSGAYQGTVIAPTRIWTWDATIGFILRGIGSDPTDFANKCYDCRQNEADLRADGSLTQQLGHGFTMVLKAATQLAVDPLVSNEQFLLGGVSSVRGYYEAEDLGDVGYRGSLEFHAPNLFGARALHLRPFVFGDSGRLHYLAPLPGQAPALHLASFGGGFDFEWTKLLTGNLVWARALDPGNPANPTTGTAANASRVLFSVKSTW
jgi:hemolysin activation/secretion protein